jgi:hypothetical protein
MFVVFIKILQPVPQELTFLERYVDVQPSETEMRVNLIENFGVLETMQDCAGSRCHSGFGPHYSWS